MRRRISLNNVASAPRGLIGMALLIVLVEVYVARHDADFTNPTAINWRFASLAARREARSHAIFCFGTSLTKNGVLPPAIAARTGRPAFNLATFNGPIPASYFLLRRTLESGAKPACILLDYQDGPTYRGEQSQHAEALRVNARQWPELLTWRDCLDLSWSARDPDFLAQMAVSHVLPSLKARHELRSDILAALAGRDGSSSFQVAMLTRHWRVNSGAHVIEKTAAGPNRPFKPSRGQIFRTQGESRIWEQDRLSEIYLTRFFETASRSEVPVFLLLPPSPPDVNWHREHSGLAVYFTKQARALLDRYPKVVVVDGRGSSYPPEVFSDGIHLDRRGASVFTVDVANVLAQYFTDAANMPRWVTLPPYRHRRFPFAVEDLDESCNVVLARMTRVRR